MSQICSQPDHNLIVLESDDEADSKEKPENDDDEVVFLSETPAIIESSDEDDVIFLSKMAPTQPLDLSSDCLENPASKANSDVKPIIIAPLPSLDTGDGSDDNSDDDDSDKDDSFSLGISSDEDKALLKELDSVDIHKVGSPSCTTLSLPAKPLSPAPSYTSPTPSYTSPTPSYASPTPSYSSPTPSYANSVMGGDGPGGLSNPLVSSSCDNGGAPNPVGQNRDQDMCQTTCTPPDSQTPTDPSSNTLDLNSVNSCPMKSNIYGSYMSMFDNMQQSLLDDMALFNPLPSVSSSQSGQSMFEPTWFNQTNTSSKTQTPTTSGTATSTTSSNPVSDVKNSYSIGSLLDDLGSKLPVNQPLTVCGNTLLPLPPFTSDTGSISRPSVVTAVSTAKSAVTSNTTSSSSHITSIYCGGIPTTSSTTNNDSLTKPLVTTSSSADQFTSMLLDPQLPYLSSYLSSSVQVKPLAVPAVTSTSQVAPSWVFNGSQTSTAPSTSQPSVPVSLPLPPDIDIKFKDNTVNIQPAQTSDKISNNLTPHVKRSNSLSKAVNVNRVVPFKKRCLSGCGDNRSQKVVPGVSGAWESNWCSSCNLLVAYENLSRCTQGHACCGTCLQQLAKAILSKGKKASLQCTYPLCDSYFSISELERTLPKMVVDILEEKLDQEYVDVASDLTWRHLVDDEEMMELGEDAMDGDESVERPLKPERSSSLLCQIPPNWESMEETAGFKLVDLEGGSAEYENCALKFHQTMMFPRADIQRIQRVQNPILWQFYSVKKTQMECENDGLPPAELSLFHGTSRHVVEAICKSGFDWRLCGIHGTMYGQGSYFARDASYSHTYTDKPPKLLYSTLTARSQHHVHSLVSSGRYFPLSGTNAHQYHSNPAVKLHRQLKQFTSLLRHQQQMLQAPNSSNFVVLPSSSTSSAPAPPPAHQNVSTSRPSSLKNVNPVISSTYAPQIGAQPLPAHSSLYRAWQGPKRGSSSGSNRTSGFLRVPVQQPTEQPGTPPEKHTHIMFLARVLVGRSAPGKSNMRKPPPLDPSDPYGLSYDSCTDNVNDPKIYVVFDSAQCYPEYIIEYDDITCNIQSM